MRQSKSLLPITATAVTGFFFAATILLTPTFVIAADQKPATPAPEQRSGGASCTCPEQRTSPWARPKYAGLKPALDGRDHVAALESVQFALTEVGDGGTYTWELTNGHLSGAVQPTSSFRDGSGKVCRHVIVLLTTGDRSSKAEGVACRLDNGVWQLEG